MGAPVVVKLAAVSGFIEKLPRRRSSLDGVQVRSTVVRQYRGIPYTCTHPFLDTSAQAMELTQISFSRHKFSNIEDTNYSEDSMTVSIVANGFLRNIPIFCLG